MTASYPTSIKSFTTKESADIFDGDHVNDLQAELVALETILGVAPATISDAVAATGTPTTVAEFLDMVANRIKTILGEANWYGTPDSTIATIYAGVVAPTWTNFTYANSWVDYSTTFNPGGYCKRTDGFVFLRGLVKSGTAGTITTLPAGYRPAYQCLFDTVENGALARVDVTTAGAVVRQVGGSTWLSLDGLCFLAEA